MLNCPKCLGKLEEKSVENVKVDICWVCEGIWFDKNELEKVIQADSVDFKKIDVGREELDGQEASGMYNEFDEKAGVCPRCSQETKLNRSDYPKGITVDICSKCQGIWLDGGEIHKLRDRTIVNIADRLYEIKSSFTNCLKLIFGGRKARKKIPGSEDKK